MRKQAQDRRRLGQSDKVVSSTEHNEHVDESRNVAFAEEKEMQQHSSTVTPSDTREADHAEELATTTLTANETARKY